MTDNASLVPNSVALPSELNFRLKQSSARGRNLRVSVLPTNKQIFNPGDVCIMYCPCGRKNTFLDTKQSYIKFTVVNNDANNTLNFDGSAGSVINRIDLFHGSNQLETIQQANVLYNYLFDFQLNQAEKYSLSTAYGFSNSIQNQSAGYTLITSSTLSSTATTSSTSATITASNSAIPVGSLIVGAGIPAGTTITAVSGTTLTLSANASIPASSSLSFYVQNYNNAENLRQGAQLGNTTSGSSYLTVALPILSGIIGLGNDSGYLPVGVLNDDIRIEITLEQTILGMVYGSQNATQTAWTVQGVELELTYIELSDEAMALVNQEKNLYDTTFIHCNSWRHYVSNMPSGTQGTYSTLVPLRFASTKSLVTLPRPAGTISSATAYCLTSRCNPQIQSYWLRCGSALIPQKYIQLQNSTHLIAGYVEPFMELQKSFHNINNTEMSGTIGFDYYNVGDIADTTVGQSGVIAYWTGANSYRNGFALANELETYANKNNVILNGLNTLNFQTFFEANMQTTGPAQNYTLDFYVNYDMIIVKDENGIMSVRF